MAKNSVFWIFPLLKALCTYACASEHPLNQHYRTIRSFYNLVTTTYVASFMLSASKQRCLGFDKILFICCFKNILTLRLMR